jgi:hypothetical protein
MVALIQKSLDALYEASMFDVQVLVVDETPLFGGDSNIDSMCFVALITDVEDRLSQLTGKDIFVVLSDIEEMYPDAPTLTAGMLSNYLGMLVDG